MFVYIHIYMYIYICIYIHTTVNSSTYIVESEYIYSRIIVHYIYLSSSAGVSTWQGFSRPLALRVADLAWPNFGPMDLSFWYR